MKTKFAASIFLALILSACGGGGSGGGGDMAGNPITPDPAPPVMPTPDPNPGVPALPPVLPTGPIPMLATGEQQRFIGAMSNGDVVDINIQTGAKSVIINPGKGAPVAINAALQEGQFRYWSWEDRRVYRYALDATSPDPIEELGYNAVTGLASGSDRSAVGEFLANVTQGTIVFRSNTVSPASQNFANDFDALYGAGGIVMYDDFKGFAIGFPSVSREQRSLVQFELLLDVMPDNISTRGRVSPINFWDLPTTDVYEGLQIDRVTGEILMFGASGAIYRFDIEDGSMTTAVSAASSQLQGIVDVAVFPAE